MGRDFYLPGQIPTGTGRGSRVFDASAKQTRLWTNLTTDVAGHTVKGYIEADFQTTAGAGSERTTNGYNTVSYTHLDVYKRQKLGLVNEHQNYHALIAHLHKPPQIKQDF